MVSAAREVPEELRLAFGRVLASTPSGQLAAATERLIAGYRGTVGTDRPVLRGRADVAAYAAYRMPATYAAVRSALGAWAALAPGRQPVTQVDIGGGTGAAAWAAADLWPSLGSVTVLDRADAALDLGRELAAFSPVLSRVARWRGQVLGADLDLPQADLVTCSYVLGELTGPDRRALVERMASRGEVVALVEPGTPAGYERIREARQQLVEAGLPIAAPCPHSRDCPMTPGQDWCHFSARLGRSALHRQIKGGSLGYEDEKFSYVVAAREPVAAAAGRVVRHPLLRKGMVQFQVCEARGRIVREVVTKKRHGELYREARDTAWGDTWPPVDGGARGTFEG